MGKRSGVAITLWVVIAALVVLSAAFLAGRARFVRFFEAAREKEAAARVEHAIKSTLALTRLRVTEKLSFPSSDKLLSTRDARELGTGLYERSIELEIPPAGPAGSATRGIRLHYSSASEDASFESYLDGTRIFFRAGTIGGHAGEAKWVKIDAGDLPRVSGALDEAARAEISWMTSVRGVDSLLPRGIGGGARVVALRRESVDGVRYIVADLRTPDLDAEFAKGSGKGGAQPEPMRYEVRVWVPEAGEAYIARLEEAYVYRMKEQETYDYVISSKLLEPDERLAIKLPEDGLLH
ncbi:MAG: hypothetical protein HPY71_15155 [Firmicutes bacterium]|nr:hypothetical protein [Bacillota bacterium]